MSPSQTESTTVQAGMTLTASNDGDRLTDTEQYLTFFLDGEEYGVDILRVQEIRGWETATPLPNTPAYMKGVINLRGTIVPLLDLRQRFGLEQTEYGHTTVVVVLKVVSGEGERIVGLIVDAVSDVYNVEEEQIKAPPEFGNDLALDFVKGLATVGEKMVILLDIDRFLGNDVSSCGGGF